MKNYCQTRVHLKTTRNLISFVYLFISVSFPWEKAFFVSSLIIEIECISALYWAYNLIFIIAPKKQFYWYRFHSRMVSICNLLLAWFSHKNSSFSSFSCSINEPDTWKMIFYYNFHKIHSERAEYLCTGKKKFVYKP